MPAFALERWHLEQLLRALEIVPDEPPEKTERPDFLLSVDGRQIGVEHTEFFLPPQPGTPPPQRIHSLQRLAVEEARRRFRDRGGPALYVHPTFNSSRGPFKTADAYELSGRFAELVWDNGWPGAVSEGARRFEVWREIPEIHSYSVIASVDGVDELWRGGGGGWVAMLDPAQIEVCLTSKSKAHAAYSQRAPELWLLVANDITRGGQPCELGPSAQSQIYGSPFNRVFWLEAFTGQVTELFTHAAD
jgi:hypothetical protein